VCVGSVINMVRVFPCLCMFCVRVRGVLRRCDVDVLCVAAVLWCWLYVRMWAGVRYVWHLALSVACGVIRGCE
jgi:hypothetical protein